MKTKLILISLCSFLLLSACEKSAQEKLAEESLKQQEKDKKFRLVQKCANQRALNNSKEAKEYGYKISQECIDYFKKNKQ